MNLSFCRDPNASIQPQVLRLIDDNQNYQALERRSLRYQRSSATEQFDTITRQGRAPLTTDFGSCATLASRCAATRRRQWQRTRHAKAQRTL